LQIKTIAVGDSGVGKSSILTRFAHDKFNEFTEPTMGAAFITKRYTMPDDQKIIEFHVILGY
jgi:GTPase SAR1 family protein